ncbi:acid phosphatase [Photobacterium kishitanii]|uniref:divergent PAP2 family protein n=1 Tax=Photobacterium kishitanii TaxID=318456 RepID=UPI000D171020|nr:divergent PAP2 family protein [Photobacterium kishitanii]PSW59963.1 acid phosphatase [Photobacterium kishitanii]
MDFSYLITPFFTWLVAGCSKFLINSIKSRQLAFKLIGYGGLPSNHTSIVCSVAALIALKDGIDTPAFGVAVGVAFIVMLDANGLRQKIAQHAVMINQLNRGTVSPQLREQIGHTRLEIFAGIITGISCAWVVNLFLPIIIIS